MKKRLILCMISVIAVLCAFSSFSPVILKAEEDDVYDVMSPVGNSTVEEINQAPRLDTLKGKTIAIVGRSFNAIVTQAVLKECLLEDYPDIKVYTVDDLGCGGVYSVFHQSAQSKLFQEKLKEYGVDAVISGNCGCGLCTVKESGSAIAAEYIGIPTVTVGATSFISEIHSTGVNRGVPVLRTAEYPGAFSADTKDELKQKSKDIIYPLVVEALTTPITQEEREQYARDGERDYDDVLVSGSYDMIQNYYKECGYTDGLPINLPTDKKVQEYLKYTPYDGDDIVVDSLPLAYRECRAYTVAVNAIMAGCPAEYMPICIAFTKCMADGEWRRTLASTHGWSPYAWLNGPIARQLGIDCSQGMISETNNKSLARFIDLAMMNLGGYYIKENRMGTFGYMSAWMFSEDEQACLNVGWKPYHVNQGYELNDNVITAASALAWGNNVTPATPDPEMIKNLIAWDVTEKEQNGLGNTNPQVFRTIFITEAVASNLAEKYTTKDQLEDALVETARRPLWLRTYANYWANTGSYQYTKRTIEEHYNLLLNDEQEQAATTSIPDWLKPLFPNESQMITVATMNKGETPILICGDVDRNKFQVMPGGGYASVEIELPSNWDDLMSEKGYEPLDNYYLEHEEPQEEIVTGPIKVVDGLSDGTYRSLASKQQLTEEGRFLYNLSTGEFNYWPFGAKASTVLTLDVESDLAQVLACVGPGSNIAVENGFITKYIIRPSTSQRAETIDISKLTDAAFKDAELTFAVTTVNNSLSGGVTPDNTSIKVDSSIAKFGVDLCDDSLLFDANNTDGFVIYDDGDFILNADAKPGSVAIIGAKLENEDRYRTFTITLDRDKYTILYNTSNDMNNPKPVYEEEKECEHEYEWIIDKEATCVEEGLKHEECKLCGDKKDAVVIERIEHDYSEWVNDGQTHKRICSVCGDVEVEDCRYNEETHVCDVCGAADPSYSELVVEVEVVKKPGRTRLSKPTYVATIYTSGSEVSKVEYSTNGRKYTTGNEYQSSSNITSLYIRVTDKNSNVSNWVYRNGKVTK